MWMGWRVIKMLVFQVYMILFLDGFFPDPSSPTKAVCVANCPAKDQAVVDCLTDSDNCPTGTITSNYATFQLLNYCILDPKISG